MHLNRFHRMLLCALMLTLLALPVLAGRADDANRKSKNGKTEGTIDGVEVTVEFGRPNVNERKIWGGLVPYDKVWRTGADEATPVSFAADHCLHLPGVPDHMSVPHLLQCIHAACRRQVRAGKKGVS